jgi:ribosomal protein S18 acetylase RimI-like enzyme
MPDVTVRAASIDDAAALAEFAARVFAEVFGPGNDEADMASYLAEAFGPEIQRAEIAAPGAIVLIAESRGGGMAGYLHIAASATPAGVTGENAVELKRLYVEPALHSRGAGKALLDEGLSRARASGAATVWLGVWEHNTRAQKFYRREGFERVGEHTFLLGSDPQTDWIMQRALTPT